MKGWFAILVLIGAGFLGFQYFKQSATESSADDTTVDRPKTGKAQARDIAFAITIAGEITPAEQISVRPEVNGRISQLPVDIGDHVAKGELLFALDDKNIRIDIETREAEIASAQLQLGQAKRNYERAQQLFKDNLVAKEPFEESKTQFDLAENAIERARKALALSHERLAKTKIMAPFSCTVLTRPVTGVGQAVSGSGGFNSGTEVLTIADLRKMIINAHVNQTDVTRLKVGMAVDVQVEAIPGLVVKGVIERVSPQATLDRKGIKGFETRILLMDVDPRVQPGMTANIKIPVESAEQVLSVPLGAVFTEYNKDRQRQERFVYVKRGDEYEKRLIQIGVADYFYAEVLSGLNEGEIVATEPPPVEAIVETAKGEQLASPAEKSTSLGGT